MSSEVTGRIARVDRVKGYSRNGNPTYRVTLDDGTELTTATDAAINYGIENPEYRNVPVRFKLNARGKIITATPVEGE